MTQWCHNRLENNDFGQYCIEFDLKIDTVLRKKV